jgi:phage gpG-like protein
MLALPIQDRAAAALADLPDGVRAELAAKASALAADLQARIRQKLTGGVLKTRSGALASSITATVIDDTADLSVGISAGGDIEYAAVHEFGGTIPPHQIVPDKARALAFLIGGKHVFAERVDLPAVTMPERSYLRASLAETTAEIREELSEAVISTLK